MPPVKRIQGSKNSRTRSAFGFPKNGATGPDQEGGVMCSFTTIAPRCHIPPSKLAVMPALFMAVKFFFLTTHPRCLRLLEVAAKKAPTWDTLVLKVNPSPEDRRCLNERVIHRMETRKEELMTNDNLDVFLCKRCLLWHVHVTCVGFKNASETACPFESLETGHCETMDYMGYYSQRFFEHVSIFCWSCGKGVVILVTPVW